MRIKALSVVAIAIFGLLFAGISVAPSFAQNNDSPGQVFNDICTLAGGTPSKNWPITRRTCRFSDGTTIWCTPTLRRCGHTTKSTIRRGRAGLLYPGFVGRARAESLPA